MNIGTLNLEMALVLFDLHAFLFVVTLSLIGFILHKLTNISPFNDSKQVYALITYITLAYSIAYFAWNTTTHTHLQQMGGIFATSLLAVFYIACMNIYRIMSENSHKHEASRG
ncbi:hypothetical protein [Shewanella sp. UCD-KL12]|uniref:hypothetical protein n=1 Tax=Shewanella sp. UCD-KL12 TaxID=1917163 RepID=UPI000970456F|nr:hypothetical protein [Shewanella sp. UCD-KL12]